MDVTEIDDSTLVQRSAQGDEGAFAALFDRHSPAVLGFLLRLTEDRGEAEELLQETFLQAWREAARYRPGGGRPRSWLMVMARSRAVDRIRSRRSRAAREEQVGRERPGSAEPAAVKRLESRETKRRLGAAMAGIPAEQRQCLELAFFAGLTHREIAERLDAPLGTVKSRILLGMRKLRAMLGEEGSAGP